MNASIASSPASNRPDAWVTRSIVRHPHPPAGRSMCWTVYTDTVASCRFSSRPSLRSTVKRGEVIEARGRRVAWRRWRQPNRGPAFGRDGEQAAESGAVDHRQICPVLYVEGKVVHRDGSCVQRVPPARDEGMAAVGSGCIENAVFLRDGRLLEIRASAGDRQSVDRHRSLLYANHELEPIGEQPANHSLGQAALLAFREAGGKSVGGRLRLEIVRLAPARKTGKTRRWVDRHVIGKAHKQEHRHRARTEVTVWQHLHPRVARASRLD